MILAALVFIPLLAAGAVLAGAPARATSLAAAAVNGLLTLVALALFKTGEPDYQFTATLFTLLEKPHLSLSFGVDGVSLVMVLLTTLVTLAAVWGSPAQLEKGSLRLYYASELLIAAGAMGAFVSTDLFFFYAFHELALIPTFLMIGLFGSGDRKAAAWKVTVYLGVGSLVLLAALGALFGFIGGQSFQFTQLAADAAAAQLPAETQAGLFLALLAGFGILISLFPFHSWAPSAYACAPAPVAMLHAGVLKKFGLYGLLRVALPLLPQGSQSQWVLNLLLFALLGNILYIGLVTIAQKELGQMLGHSSVMHMGYVFLGIASWNTIGLGGAVLLMFAHGLSIALLFLLNGQISQQAGTTHFDRVGGLAAQAPGLSVLFGFATFASIGLPGFANFAGELSVFFGAFKNSVAQGALWLPLAVGCALWGVVISAVYGLRAYRRLFFGTAPENAPSVSDLLPTVKAPAWLLVAVLLLTGFFPNLILHLVRPVFAVLTGHP